MMAQPSMMPTLLPNNLTNIAPNSGATAGGMMYMKPSYLQAQQAAPHIIARHLQSLAQYVSLSAQLVQSSGGDH
jgi:hypothetical protein